MKHEKKFYGSTVIGEKGQMVVPAEARKQMKLKKGEKLLVFGFHEDTLMIAKVSSLGKYMQDLSEKMQSLKDIMDNSL